jgi:hypothetical protein
MCIGRLGSIHDLYQEATWEQSQQEGETQVKWMGILP